MKPKQFNFFVCCQGDPAAGLCHFNDDIKVIIDSGNPGGEPGEFEEFMAECLAEWYSDEATVTLTSTC